MYTQNSISRLSLGTCTYNILGNIEIKYERLHKWLGTENLLWKLIWPIFSIDNVSDIDVMKRKTNVKERENLKEIETIRIYIRIISLFLYQCYYMYKYIVQCT